MFSFSTVRRRLASGVMAGQLLFGALAIGAATPSEAATVLRAHGAWHGVVDDSTAAFGAMTEMDNGGVAMFLVKNGSLSLMLGKCCWTADSDIDVSVRIDGRTFEGYAQLVNRETIEVPDVSREVLDMFVDGAEGVVNVDNGRIVWTLELDGFTASMADAMQYVRNIRSSY
jgi:hypothetical protein